MKVRIISELEDLNIIQDDWRDLFVSVGISTFQSFEFNYYSWKTELSKNKLNRLCVVLLKTNVRISAILPLYIDAQKRLRFINDTHADFCDVLSNESFDFESILSKISAQYGFNAAHFINLQEGSFFYDLFKIKSCRNSFLKPFEKYSDITISAGSFPDNSLRYTSKQKTVFRRVKKKNSDSTCYVLSKDDIAFPVKEIHQLKERMIELGLRKDDFLNEDRLLLLKELYDSSRMIVSMTKNKNDINAISFILRNDSEYLFWIDMYDNTKMINIYNYISFMENISCGNSVKINFGRGMYDYKVINFKPDIKQLFAVYLFENQIQLMIFIFIDKIKDVLKSTYKKIKI